MPLLELAVEELGLLDTAAALEGVTFVAPSLELSIFKRPEEGGGAPLAPLGDGPPLELLANELLPPTVGRVPTPPMGIVGLGAVGVPTLLKLCDGLMYGGTTP